MDTRSLANIHLSLAGMIYSLGITAKIGCLLSSMFFLLSFLFDPLKPLAVTPGYLIPPNFWIWTLVTHPFIETNIVLLICGIIVLVLNANILEESMTSLKLFIYYCVLCISSALLSSFFYLILYMCTFDIDYLFEVHIYGAGGLLGGSLVALKQAFGDHPLIGAIGLHVKDTVLVIGSVILLGRIVGLLRGSYVTCYFFGVTVGWTYLRFYQSDNRGRGDQTEKFAFKYFFPKMLQPTVGVTGDALYKLLLKLKICRKTVYRYDVGAPSNIALTLSGVNALDAERRRNKAIKALDERLKKSTVDSSAWPSLDGEAKDNENDKSAISESESKISQDSSSIDGSTSPDIVTIDMDNSSPVENIPKA